MFRTAGFLTLAVTAGILGPPQQATGESRFAAHREHFPTGERIKAAKASYVDAEEVDSSQDALLLRSVRTRGGATRSASNTRSTARVTLASFSRGSNGSKNHYPSGEYSGSSQYDSKDSDHDAAYDTDDYDADDYEAEAYGTYSGHRSSISSKLSRLGNRGSRLADRVSSRGYSLSTKSLLGLRERMRDGHKFSGGIKSRLLGHKGSKGYSFGHWRDWLCNRDWSWCDWPCNPRPCKPDPCEPDPCKPDPCKPDPCDPPPCYLPEPSGAVLGLFGLATLFAHTRRHRHRVSSRK